MSTVPLPDLDAEYRQIREECGLLDRADRFSLTVSGTEAAEFLQGQVTNDVEGLGVGEGCYAALLNRKGHLQADMRILHVADGEFWIDTEGTAGPRVLKHFSMYKIGRQVEAEAADRRILSLVGPGAIEVAGLAPGDEYDSTGATIAGSECVVVATDLGLDVIVPGQAADAVIAELESKRAIPVSADAVEILRVESGRPRFGKEMTEASMPAEAGIVEKAVNFTKGCYIGQEPVARLHYRGKPNRHLRGLRFSGPVEAGSTVRLGERDLGAVGTAVLSPATGQIGMAILRKEAEPGSTVVVETNGSEIEAEVVELPFIEDPAS
ncbi:MAG TPA: glycine cleavage T C-terminal barrel domain-containing protein [Solirubrobacterales bacterium]|nr:glycine cleavage T C-terminal barrel domain-containing protein [Solirubrobacterales bacterium]